MIVNRVIAIAIVIYDFYLFCHEGKDKLSRRNLTKEERDYIDHSSISGYIAMMFLVYHLWN